MWFAIVCWFQSWPATTVQTSGQWPRSPTGAAPGHHGSVWCGFFSLRILRSPSFLFLTSAMFDFDKQLFILATFASCICRASCPSAPSRSVVVKVATPRTSPVHRRPPLPRLLSSRTPWPKGLVLLTTHRSGSTPPTVLSSFAARTLHFVSLAVQSSASKLMLMAPSG